MPPTDILVALPNHEVLMRALCCYDLIGLQTETGVRAFLDYMAREANGHLEIDGSLSAYDRMTRVAAFPIGIDTEAFAESAARAVRSSEATRLRHSLNGRQLIIGVDRMDYSKGIPTRFEAIDANCCRPGRTRRENSPICKFCRPPGPRSPRIRSCGGKSSTPPAM